MPTLRGLRLGFATLLAAVAFVPSSARAMHVTPTAITFAVNHADCAGAGFHRFDFYLNDFLLTTAPTTQDCTCNVDPLVVTVTDPAALAHFDPSACNSFRVDASDGGIALVVAFARVTVSSLDVCLFDGFPGNPAATCADRDTCAGAGFTMDVASVGSDDDADGVAAGVGHGCDNCPLVANPAQADGDGDGIGDACESCAGDSDGDGVCDDVDNCPTDFNPGQADSDGDGVGDACEGCVGGGTSDGDGDGFCDEADNCPDDPNPTQSDGDGDGLGDACDDCAGPGLDDDGDAICNGIDNCPGTANPGQDDSDADGVGDACDNCPSVANPTQADQDFDGIGDVCDACPTGADADQDGVCDAHDGCPTVFDPGQEDGDADGVGDACDNCLAVPNPGQEDTNADGIADACSPRVAIDLLQPNGGHVDAEVTVESSDGHPLSGMVHILRDGGVGALRYTWLATTCIDGDTLDLTIGGSVVARVQSEPEGSHCTCTPFVSSYDVPLPDALALLGPGVNQLGIRKSTGLPAEARTTLAWAYATITVGGVAQQVPLFDESGGNDFDDPNLCISGHTFDALDAQADTPPLPPAALSQPWTGELPCMLDLSALAPNQSYTLLVTATDGVVATPSADARPFDRASEVALTINGAVCDDGDGCTVDACTPGGCTHTAVVCGAGDQCHDAGVCDPTTGACSNPAKPEGSACSDGNACTTTDTCRAGTCTGTSPVVCSASDQCHTAGVCNPATGTCSAPPKPDGATCDDGDGCTFGDACRAGTCRPASTVECVAPDACHEATCSGRGQCHVKRILPASVCKPPHGKPKSLVRQRGKRAKRSRAARARS